MYHIYHIYGNRPTDSSHTTHFKTWAAMLCSVVVLMPSRIGCLCALSTNSKQGCGAKVKVWMCSTWKSGMWSLDHILMFLLFFLFSFRCFDVKPQYDD